MDKLAQFLEKLRSSNVLTAKDRALDFAVAISKAHESQGVYFDLAIKNLRIENKEIKERLETLERRLGILTHG
jgi:hypothetical protein